MNERFKQLIENEQVRISEHEELRQTKSQHQQLKSQLDQQISDQKQTIDKLAQLQAVNAQQALTIEEKNNEITHVNNLNTHYKHQLEEYDVKMQLMANKNQEQVKQIMQI